MTKSTTLSRPQLAQKTVKNYTTAAAAIGLVVLPAVDSALLLAAQVKMLKDLSELYGVPFSSNRSKTLIASLAGAIAPLSLTTNLFSLCKTIPVVGTTIGILGMPLLGGASTYAVGQVFIHHYETGGTLLDFNPDKMKAYYQAQFEAGKKVVKQSSAGIRP